MNARVASGLLLGVLAVSWAAIFIRMAHAPALVTAAVRLTLASVPLLGWVLVRHRAELRALTRSQWKWLALSGVALAAHFASWIRSLDFTSVASSVALVTTTPIWVSLLERPPRRTVVGMFLAMVGTVVIAGTDFALSGAALWGDALALLGALCAATYLSIGRKVRRSVGVTTYVGVVYPVAALCLLAGALGTGARWELLSTEQWQYLALLALIPQLVGHSLLNWALEHVSAALVAIAILGEPVFSTVLAVLLLDEQPGAVRALGAAVVLLGVGLAAWSESQAKRDALPPAADTRPDGLQ